MAEVFRGDRPRPSLPRGLAQVQQMSCEQHSGSFNVQSPNQQMQPEHERDLGRYAFYIKMQINDQAEFFIYSGIWYKTFCILLLTLSIFSWEKRLLSLSNRTFEHPGVPHHDRHER